MADAPQSKARLMFLGIDIWSALDLVLLIAIILLARQYLLEPYKIPSGSMEPTLFGHEDHGDRIVTGKLAYAPAVTVWLTLAGAVVLIVLKVFASSAWKSRAALLGWGALLTGIVGSTLYNYSHGNLAGNPKRFEVVVFRYNTEWSGGKNQEINYIKRLIGEPGDTIRISGGDLYLKTGLDWKIIRKPAEIQEQFWFPISTGFRTDLPADLGDEAKKRIRFPWKARDGAGTTLAEVEIKNNALTLNGSEVVLEYGYPVTNMYVKQGRWEFRHVGCPSANKPGIEGSGGLMWRNPGNTPEEFSAYVGNTQDWVRDPHCGAVLFPILSYRDPSFMSLPRPTEQPNFTPASLKFFYGGESSVGDLRVDIGIKVEKAGGVVLEAGNTMRRAVWALGADAPSDATAQAIKGGSALTPGEHQLSLRYIDGAIEAYLDGTLVERRELDVTPPGKRHWDTQSVVRVRFAGVQGAVTKLDLSRDLFYLSETGPRGTQSMSKRDREHRDFDPESGDYIARVPKDRYLVLGDNAPSSADGREWGFVPRENFVGRAWFVWWPLSRVRSIK